MYASMATVGGVLGAGRIVFLSAFCDMLRRPEAFSIVPAAPAAGHAEHCLRINFLKPVAAACLLGGALAGCGAWEQPAGVSGAALAFNEPVDSEAADRSPWQGVAAYVHQSIVVEHIDGKVGHHASTLAAFADGELLAAWYSYAGPQELDGSAIYLARRPAGASTWGEPLLHLDRSGGDGNPVLYAEGDSVWLFSAAVPFGWSTARIEVQRSNDRGLTWTAPRAICGPPGANVRFAPVRLADGRLLLPAYDDLWLRPLFFASADDETWDLQPTFAPQQSGHRAIQPSAVQLDGGRILSVMRNTEGGFLWVTASDDAGQSWTPARDAGFDNPDSAAALFRLASGRLLLALNDDAAERDVLSVVLSPDEGRTWPFRRILSAGTPASERSYPFVVQSPDGLIHIAFTEGRERIRHVELNESWMAAD